MKKKKRIEKEALAVYVYQQGIKGVLQNRHHPALHGVAAKGSCQVLPDRTPTSVTGLEETRAAQI
jgi:hypothetical protein